MDEFDMAPPTRNWVGGRCGELPLAERSLS
jgi:hypothetical protein